MNTQLLQEIKARILAQPEKLDMREFLYTKENRPPSEIAQVIKNPERTECGTVACIAGFAVALTTEEGIAVNEGQWFHLGVMAVELTYPQASRLFYATEWPNNFRTRYWRATCDNKHQEAAQVAVERIDHFIKTNGEE